MSAPKYHEIDRIAAEGTHDIRTLCGVWVNGGSAALDAAVRDDPAWTFAVLDGRHANTGAVHLLAMRSASRGVALVFGQAKSGERYIVTYGMTAYRGFILVADPCLSNVAVSAGGTSLAADEPPAEALATDFAWRFDVGVSAVVNKPRALIPTPTDIGPFSRPDVSESIPALLAALDGAAALLAGRTSYFDGLHAVRRQGLDGGLTEDDRDMSKIYSVDCQRDDLDLGLQFRRRSDESRGWPQELAHYEDFARTNAEGACRSLIDRFRSKLFAEAS